jgi:hypothetical protein
MLGLIYMLIETSADFKYTFSNNSKKNLINFLGGGPVIKVWD